MELHAYFKSVIDQDTSEIVLCDLEHKILYMNPAASRQYGALLGKDLMACHNERSAQMIRKVVSWFEKDTKNNLVHTFYNEKKNKDVYMVALRDETGKLIGYYEKHEFRNRDMTPLYGLD